jgi:predicted NBD/HSP70 family sugar kinase
MKKNKIGIDLGGIKLLGVIVDSSYNILKRK